MRKSPLRGFDLLLMLVVLALIGIGEVMIYSSYEAPLQQHSGDIFDNLVFRQGVAGAAGLIACLVAAVVDYRVLISLKWGVYVLALGMLGVTLILGNTSFGAQSWFELLRFNIQPSEVAKILILVVLAWALGADSHRLESLGPLLRSLLIVGPPAAMIYLQPDFGTALVLVSMWAAMVFMSGVRWRHLILLGVVAVIAIPVVWLQLEPYMRNRVLTFFFPDQATSDAKYNVTQALISIGSGGWWGKGLLHGTQSQLAFLRVRHTDFIFSVLAEELGFAGAMLLLGLFAVLLMRLIRIASRARDAEGRLIVTGVATMIFVQAFINLGMNASIMPVTGLPLPFVSYGGSSLLTTLLGVGLAQSVAIRSKPEESPLL